MTRGKDNGCNSGHNYYEDLRNGNLHNHRTKCRSRDNDRHEYR